MDPRFLKEQGTSIFTGNELIVKGALENGVGEITGYPGSPLAELFDTLESIRDLLNERGIVAQIANNEALAAARLNGAQMADIRAMAVMKSWPARGPPTAWPWAIWPVPAPKPVP